MRFLGMKVGYRRRRTRGPWWAKFSVNQSGPASISSIGFKLFGFLGWNTNRDGTSIDLPGGFHGHVEAGPKFATRRRARRAARRSAGS